MNNNPRSSVASSRNWGAFQIALLYLTIGVLWILFSDEAAVRLAPNRAVLTQISIYKGWGFVLVSALLLYWMIRLHTQRISQAELTLSEREKSYQELLQQASDGIFIADAKGNYTLVNEEACRLVGYTKDELLSMNLRELVAPEDLGKTPLRLDELRAGKTLITERKLLRKDGSRILCEISAKQLPDGRYQSIIRDITERKVTEEALRRSEERYRSLFKNMNNGFARCQILYEKGIPTDFVYLDINDAFKKLTGLQDVIGKRVSAVIPGIRESNPELFEIYGRVALTGQPEKFETYVPGLGSGAWFSVSVYSTEKEFFVTVFETITERKKAETALRENEARLNGIIASAMDAIISVDSEQSIVLINAAAEKMFGYPASEAVGKPLESFIPERFRAAHHKHIRTFGETGVTNRALNTLGVIFGLRANGEEFPIEASISQIEIDNKKLYTVILRDITERKRAENQQRYMANLIENVSDAIISTDAAFNILSWNHAAEALYGWQSEEVLDKPLNDFIRNEFVDSTREESIAEVFGKGIWKGEVIQHGRDGHAINILAAVSLIRDSSQQPMGLVAINRDITERKQVEDTRAQLAAIVDSSDDAIIGKTLGGVITSWNSGAEHLYGYSAEEALGQSIAFLIPADRLHELPEILDQIKRGEGVKYFETERLGKNDTHLSVSLTISPIKNAMGQVTGASTVARDITERRQAEEKILASELRYRRLFESAKDGILILDADTGMVVDVNPFLTKLLGYSHDVFLGKTIWELGFFKDIVANKANFLELQQKEYIRYEDLPLETANGRRINVEFVSNVYLVDRRKVVQCNIRDITERKQVEDTLHATQKLLQDITDNSTTLIYALDLDGRFLLINRKLESVFGVPRETLIAQTREMILPHEIAAAHRSNDLRVIAAQQPITIEEENETADGKIIYLSTKFPLRDVRGGVYGIGGISTEITERKHAEDELKRSNAELEQFAYVASHDLQEPLRAVAGMVQLLQQRYQGKLDERADEYIGHAVDASTRMQNLINDLLSYSRVDRFGKPLAETDLESCLKNALTNLQVSIQESNAQITHTSLPVVRADAAQLTQVLQNLMGNAIKFRGAEPLHIHIGAKKNEHNWQFEVSDNGIGIEPKYFERIFLVFQRLHTRREYPGTGIGLALCKKIIERHAGQIWVESQPGQGSTFYFTIPEKKA